MAELQSETLDYLTLIHATLNLCSEETNPIFASAADCDFFRALHRATTRAVPPSTPLASVAIPIKKITPENTEKKKDHPGAAASVIYRMQEDFVNAETRENPENLRKAEQVENLESKPADRFHKISTSQNSQNPTERGINHFQEMREILTKVAPSLHLIDSIPNDAEAKRVANRWKTKNQSVPLSVLSLAEPEPHRKLLEHLALALHVVFGNAGLVTAGSIEKEKQWEAFLSVPELKLVIICDATLRELPNLLQFYREVPSQNERFLHHTPLFLLPDLTLYLKDPLLKRSLWKALCLKIA